MRVGVIGGGLCGLTAAIRLAQRGVDVELFEASPFPGGRTRSFFEPHMQQWVDNGPHLLSGAYHQTLALLDEAGASNNITWQPSLTLPLWDSQRGHFLLRPKATLPLAISLPLACMRLPGHNWADIPAFLRLARHLRQHPDVTANVQSWLNAARVPAQLRRDLLEPLCLGAMNETLAEANAASFRTVLRSAFANHANARLGWFRMPLSKALIRPLLAMAADLGVHIHAASRIRSMHSLHAGCELRSTRGSARFDACIIALPQRAGEQLLALRKTAVTRRITNIHMWFHDMPPLPHPFIGSLGATGQWFFDVSSQMQCKPADPMSSISPRHICAVISADAGELNHHRLTRAIVAELEKISGHTSSTLAHVRIVSEKHATTSVADTASENRLKPALSGAIIDACEAPCPGELPATIEYAVKRGNQAAEQCCLQLTR